jgi:acetyl esterase/lipase
MQEGALDLARAVRHVRSRAEDYGIDPNNIAVMGFSAGGILCGEMLLNFDGSVDGRAIDLRYIPDEVDTISADASAVGMIYSFYGRLSVASTDVEKFRASNLPPAYFLYGTRDPFVNQFAACVEALRRAGIPVESRVLQDWPHGFGAADGEWIKVFDIWLSEIMAG